MDLSDTNTTQLIRLADVFLIAPFLLYLSTRPGLTKAEKAALIIIGTGTLLYNGYRYLQVKKES